MDKDKLNIVGQLQDAAKDSVNGGKQILGNYIRLLKNYFRDMSRPAQEELIIKFSWIFTLGAVAWTWCLIYPLFHLVIRLVAFPLTLIAAYWFGRNVVSRIIIERFNKYLNNE